MKIKSLKTQAFSLIELSVVMAVIAILTTATAPVMIRAFEIKAGEKTALEMALIQDAARNFYANKNQWPKDLSELQLMNYLNPTWQGLNPWGDLYVISNNLTSLKVATGKVPQNLQDMVISRLPMGQKDAVSVFSTISAPGISAPAIEPGVIVAWKGSINTIPIGWALCDGKNGTPNLLDKFIIGASVDSAGRAVTQVTGSFTEQGGNLKHDHGGVTGAHQLTEAEMPAHQHANGYGEVFTELAPFGVAWKYGGGQWGSGSTDRDNYQWLTDSVGGNQGHAHTIANTEHLPPYYALAFIMKL